MEMLHRPPTRIELDVEDLEFFSAEMLDREKKEESLSADKTSGTSKPGNDKNGRASPKLSSTEVSIPASAIAAERPAETPASSSGIQRSGEPEYLESPVAGWLLLPPPEQ
ncbi:unnamed protein product [Notodromas monacha]|uniref:Anaphase-promoting complex subunit CDC26 n=1 Tax=Notodromas monacha TaxID=399045 RepID=A0A7R9BSU2_9CRUS|nr:unnamed protein product [Notodromas monacha]CAG0920767.1 unnamed protein product [Notodromas monacha]